MCFLDLHLLILKQSKNFSWGWGGGAALRKKRWVLFFLLFTLMYIISLTKSLNNSTMRHYSSHL